MKRLSKENFTDKEVTDFIYNEFKNLLTCSDVIEYVKKTIQTRRIDVEELTTDEYDAEEFVKSVMRQCQDLYDSCYDRFFCEGPDGTLIIDDPSQDPTNPNSKTFTRVSDYIYNFSKYNDKKLSDLILKNKKLIKVLKQK